MLQMYTIDSKYILAVLNYLAGVAGLICLTFDTKIHDVITTNSAIINYNVPGPKSDSIPFFDFEPLKKSKTI